MAAIANVRQEKILEWLKETPTLTIDHLVSSLNVSVMTVHRDLDALVRAGVVEKVHGGVKRVESRKHKRLRVLQMCDLCDLPVSERAGVMIKNAEGGQLYACCPHCAILMLDDVQNVVSVLGKDFIYGRAINITQATFIIASVINLCCAPNVLTFASREDAIRFQVGFGGDVMNFTEAYHFILENHRQFGFAANS